MLTPAHPDAGESLSVFMGEEINVGADVEQRSAEAVVHVDVILGDHFIQQTVDLVVLPADNVSSAIDHSGYHPFLLLL